MKNTIKGNNWMAEMSALMNIDIRTFGCRVKRDNEKCITIFEPLSYKAPSIARPYCCYINTVIFYVYPYEVIPDPKGSGCGRYREWDRVESLMCWDAVICFDGQRYETGGGHVVRLEKAWWMRRWAKLKPEARGEEV